MKNNQFVISIGDHKWVIFAKIFTETNSMTAVITLANTQTNRRLLVEKEISDLKAHRNCKKHTYKAKNHKYKTVHKCLVYNFMNTQDRSKFMDNLVKFLIKRKFTGTKKNLQIFELIKNKGKEAWSISQRKIHPNPRAAIFPMPKAYYKKKKKRSGCKGQANQIQVQSTSYGHAKSTQTHLTILQRPPGKMHSNKIHVKRKKSLSDSMQRKNSLLQKKLVTQSRPITRSITRKNS